ncbi:MAG: hypothetical protein ACOH2J_18245 [Allorhizobium sp.]
MTGSASELSDGLSTFIREFQHAVEEGQDGFIEISEPQHALKVLGVLHKLAVSLELELRCFRDMEMGRTARSFLDEQASGHASELMTEAEGKVVRPDFGKGGRP